MNKKILCTLGPSSFNEKTIFRLSKIGVYLFRINLSHTNVEDISPKINMIRQYSDTPICLDSEGAQIRTGTFKENTVEIESGSSVILTRENIEGTEEEF